MTFSHNNYIKANHCIYIIVDFGCLFGCCLAILESYGVPATPRTRRGIDIDAGCGQLKSDLIKKQNLQNTGTTITTMDTAEIIKSVSGENSTVLL